jgi:hypothetical protein
MILSKKEKGLLLDLLAVHPGNPIAKGLHDKISTENYTQLARVGRWDIRMSENKYDELDIKIYLDGSDEFCGHFAMEHLEYSTDEGSVYGPILLNQEKS